jgi:menaquinone-dependent protoporphyrinogen IX oxidase
MKGIIIYDSTYGNTRQIAEAISGAFLNAGIAVDTLYVKDAKKLNAADYDFMVVGSPCKCGAPSFAIKRFLNKIKETEWKDKPFAAFDTENPENIELARKEKKNYSAAVKIGFKLRDKRLVQIAPALLSVVQGIKGPLKDGETERAKGYAGVLASCLKGETVREAVLSV